MPEQEKLKTLYEKSIDGRALDERRKFARKIEEKLMRSYAPPAGDREAVDRFRAFVRLEIKKLLKRSGRIKISEADLRTLEAVVRANSFRERRVVEERTRKLQEEEKGRVRECKSQDEESKVDDWPDDDYQVLLQADAIEFNEERLEEKKNLRLRQIHLKRDLDEQVDALHRRRREEQKLDEEFGKKLLKDSEDYKKTVALQKLQKLEENRKDKEQREAQLKERRSNREREERNIKRGESAELMRIQNELKNEKLKVLAKVEKQRQFVLEVSRENEALKRERIRRQKIENELEQKRIQAYSEKLDEEERQREENLRKLQERSSHNEKVYVQATAARDNHLREEERKIAAVREQRARLQEQKEMEQKESRRRDLIEVDKVLKSQIREKQEAEKEKKRQFHASAVEAQKQAELFRLEQAEYLQRQKLQAEELRLGLDQQVEEKAKPRAPTKMTHFEKLINAPRFEEISANPKLREQVAQNLRHAGLNRSAKKVKPKVRESYW